MSTLLSKGIFVGSVIVTGFGKPDTYYDPSKSQRSIGNYMK